MIYALLALALVTPPVAAQAKVTKPHVLLISIDGLRADRMHTYGHSQPNTPNIDIVAKHGTRFELAFSQSNESLLSHAAMFTGRYPSEIAWPDYRRFVLPPGETTVAEMMVAAGYRTGSFNAGGHIKPIFGFMQGFQTHAQGADFGSFQDTVPMAIDWIQKPDEKPFFAFVHGYDCHRPHTQASVFYHPFQDTVAVSSGMERKLKSRNWSEVVFNGVDHSKLYPTNQDIGRVWHNNGEQMLDPAHYLKLAAEFGRIDSSKLHTLSQAELVHLNTHYDACALSADAYLGFLFQALVTADLWKNTLVIITADHGEDLQDHGYTNHRAVVYDSTTRVPFIIGGGAVPQAQRGTVRQDLAEAIDIVPTLAAIAQITPPAVSRGEDLMAGPKVGQFAISQGVLGQRSIRSKTHRLTFSGLSLTDPQYLDTMRRTEFNEKHWALFSVKDDINEQINILKSDPNTANMLRAELIKWAESLHISTIQAPKNEAAERELQAQGYW